MEEQEEGASRISLSQPWKDCKTTPFVLPSSEPTLENLLVLMKNHCWQPIVNISAQLMVKSNEPMMERAFCLVAALRFESLFRLKMYDDLNNEVNSALDFFFESGDLDMAQSHVVGFVSALKLLQSEVKLMTGRSFDSLQQLSSIKKWLRESTTISEKDMVFWHWQTACHIINNNIRSRNWKNSIRLLRDLFIDVDQRSQSEPDTVEQLNLSFSKVVLLLRIARVLLQIGAFSAAKHHYKQTLVIIEHIKDSLILNNHGAEYAYVMVLANLTNGLLLFAEEKFQEARDAFEIVMKGYEEAFLPTNPVLLIFQVLYQSKDDSPLAVSVNNFAICSLHLKSNLLAIETIEELVEENPVKFLNDSIVFNLCTMYDLSFSAEHSLAKKKSLQRLASRYGINDPVLNWRSFRLS